MRASAEGAVPPGPPKSVRYQSAGVDLIPRKAHSRSFLRNCADA